MYLSPGFSCMCLRKSSKFQTCFQKGFETGAGGNWKEPESAQRHTQGCGKDLAMTRPEIVAKMVKSRNAKSGVRIKNSRVRSEKFQMTRRQVFLIIFMLFLFMGSGIGYVWSNFERTQIGYDLSKLKKEEMALREINRKLRLELATLKSPQYLETIATKKLGLRQPTLEQIIVLP